MSQRQKKTFGFMSKLFGLVILVFAIFSAFYIWSKESPKTYSTAKETTKEAATVTYDVAEAAVKAGAIEAGKHMDDNKGPVAKK